MLPRPFSLEFKNYPFTESSTFRVNDTLFFPADFLSDAHIYATRAEIYEITGIYKSRRTIRFTIGTPFNKDLITGEYSWLPDKADDDYGGTIDLFDEHGRRAGILVIRSAVSLFFFPDGDYQLRSGTAKFEVTCHVFTNRKTVQCFKVGDKLLSGDVEWKGTQGVILTREDNVITVHFTGEPYYRLWLADLRNELYFSRCVTSLDLEVKNEQKPENNISVTLVPDEYGNIPIYVGSCENEALRIRGQKDSLEIKLAH